MAARWAAADWCAALADGTEIPEPVELELLGSIPRGLHGILYKCGPARFMRGGQRYKHWLEGDGSVLRLELGPAGASFRSRFVRTANFEAEERAGRVLTRGTFGTPRDGGALANAFDLRLKNPANTHVARRGDRRAPRH